MHKVKPLLFILKKELKSYFDHPVAYIFLVVFLAINSFFFFRTAYIYNIADLRSMFSSFLWLFLFIVPAITMRLIAEERQRHTLEILFVQPIREWHIIIGKFLGGLAFIFIALLLTLFIPIFLSFYGDFDWGTLFAQYLGALLLGAAGISIGLFASSITKNQIVSFMISVVTFFVLMIIGYELVLFSLSGLVKNIFEQLSLSWHYSNIIRGVLDLRDIIYFFTATASFLALSYWFLIRQNINPKRALWRQLKIGIVVLIGIAIVINLLGIYIHGRLDLTSQKLYTLSAATKNIVKDLSDVVTVDFYRSDELPAEVSVTARDVTDLLSDYEVVSGGNLKIVYHNVNTENATEAEMAGIQPVQFNTLKSDEFQVKRGYFGLTVTYTDQTEIIPFIETSDDFEYRLTSLVRKMTAESGYTVGFLSGHQEKSLMADYLTLNQELSKQYNVVTVTIDSETGQFDTRPDILIIAGTSAEITDDEKEVLRTYINDNGKVLFLVDAVNIDMQTLQTTVNQFSLADLIEEFGIRVNSDIVGDMRSHESISLGGGVFSYVVPYPLWPRTTAAEGNPITSDISSVSMPWVSSLTATDQGKKIDSLLTTTEAGFSQLSNYNLLPDQQFNVPAEQLSQKVIAAAVTNQSSEAQSVNDMRMVVVGDSDFLTETYLQSNQQALIFFLNAVDWLAQDEELISVRSKQRQAAALVFEEDGQKNMVKYVNLIGVPLIVIIFGFVYLYQRRRITKRKYS